jgi:hypothetical protein
MDNLRETNATNLKAIEDLVLWLRALEEYVSPEELAVEIGKVLRVPAKQ